MGYKTEDFYLDDILIDSKSVDEHVEHAKRVMIRFREG